MASLHISINAETIFHLGPVPITNSILTSWIVTALIIGVALWAKNNVKMTKRPKGLQNFLELVVESLYGLTNTITESPARTKVIFPFVFGFFTFILLNNWLGLFPGVGTINVVTPSEAEHARIIEPSSPWVKPVQAGAPKQEAKTTNHESAVTPAQVQTEELPTEAEPAKTTTLVPLFRAATADLNTTVALALVSVIGTQILGVKFLGLSYFSRFFTLKGPIDTFVGLLETISEISKILSFSFRLFGNIFAGEVLLAVMAFLAPLVVPMPFLALEIFVGVIQAFVFAMLSLVFMNMATHGHSDEGHA